MEENIGNFSLAKIQSILSNRKYLLIIVLIFVGSVFGLLSLIPSKKEPPATGLPHPSINPSIPFDNISYPSKPPTTISPFPKKDAIIAKVGEENIYQSDLNIEMDGYPPVKNLDVRDFLLKKIVTDSIILQGGQKDNIVQLDDSIFNNPNKDYKKRIQSVEKVKKTIEEQAEQIEGYVVSIWFYNDNLGSLGYDKGKELAYSKITKLHQDVKSGKLTIVQVGEAIKNDTSLAQIDVNYKGNAIFQFKNKKRSDTISFDADFDAALWKLAEGEASDVFALKDKNYKTGIVNEALYTFGQVDKMIVNPTLTSFDNWLEKYKKLMKSNTFKYIIFLSGTLVFFLLLTHEVIATAPEVRGRVLRQDTNAPIPDIWVRWSDLEPPARYQDDHGVRFTKTNTNGDFTFCSWQKSATCADVASCNNNVMIDTDWNSSNESRLARTSDGHCSSGFGCGENSHRFTAVVPAGWLGLFTTVSGYDLLNIDHMNNVEQPIDIGIFYYVPPLSPTPICGY